MQQRTREQAIQAGHKLRTLREEMHLTQQDIERRTSDRFGHEARVYAQQVSRIENGGLEKPPILDLLRYGQVLNLSPDDIAEMYGLWPRTKPAEAKLDPRLQAAIDLAAELGPNEREKFLEWVRFTTLQARAESAQSTPAPAPKPERANVKAPEKRESTERVYVHATRR